LTPPDFFFLLQRKERFSEENAEEVVAKATSTLTDVAKNSFQEWFSPVTR
jgi:hypothetical protein